MTEYENFDELKDNNPELADRLLNMVGQGDWQNYQLFCYEDSNEYAQYEVCEGWYADLGLDNFSEFNGAPNLYDYIDFDSLGEDLLNSADESEFVEIDDHVITSNCGF